MLCHSVDRVLELRDFIYSFEKCIDTLKSKMCRLKIYTATNLVHNLLELPQLYMAQKPLAPCDNGSAQRTLVSRGHCPCPS